MLTSPERLMMPQTLPIDEGITAEEWRDRFIHIAQKLAVINGISEQEMQWVRDAGYPCSYASDNDES
jgi:hypothetical protein